MTRKGILKRYSAEAKRRGLRLSPRLVSRLLKKAKVEGKSFRAVWKPDARVRRSTRRIAKRYGLTIAQASRARTIHLKTGQRIAKIVSRWESKGKLREARERSYRTDYIGLHDAYSQWIKVAPKAKLEVSGPLDFSFLGPVSDFVPANWRRTLEDFWRTKGLDPDESPPMVFAQVIHVMEIDSRDGKLSKIGITLDTI